MLKFLDRLDAWFAPTARPDEEVIVVRMPLPALSVLQSQAAFVGTTVETLVLYYALIKAWAVVQDSFKVKQEQETT